MGCCEGVNIAKNHQESTPIDSKPLAYISVESSDKEPEFDMNHLAGNTTLMEQVLLLKSSGRYRDLAQLVLNNDPVTPSLVTRYEELPVKPENIGALALMLLSERAHANPISLEVVLVACVPDLIKCFSKDVAKQYYVMVLCRELLDCITFIRALLHGSTTMKSLMQLMTDSNYQLMSLALSLLTRLCSQQKKAQAQFFQLEGAEAVVQFIMKHQENHLVVSRALDTVCYLMMVRSIQDTNGYAVEKNARKWADASLIRLLATLKQKSQYQQLIDLKIQKIIRTFPHDFIKEYCGSLSS